MLSREITAVNVSVIDARRRELGYTFIGLGKEIGVAPNRTAGLCRGTVKWRINVLQKTLDILLLRPNEVINNEVVLESYLHETLPPQFVPETAKEGI